MTPRQILRITLALMALIGVPGCARRSRSAPLPDPPPIELTGVWIMGRSAAPEPPPGAVVVQAACWTVPDSWIIEKDSARRGITLRFSPGHAPVPIPIKTYIQLFEWARGDYQAGGWSLQGSAGARNARGVTVRNDRQREEPVTYRLTYHAQSRHLRGTRNTEPVWLAPLSVQHPPDSECNTLPH